MADRLDGVHPLLVQCVGRILDAMDAEGHPMMVTDGVRSEAQQAKLYAQGRTAPGRVITNADGTTKRSNHQPRLVGRYAGYGCAVDCAFVAANGRPTWDIRLPWARYGELAKAVGLIWGGDWQTLRDMPHIELPKE